MENEPIDVNSEAYTVAEFNLAEAAIEAIRKKSDFDPDMSTKEGYEISRRLSLDTGKVLTSIDKACKREKQFLAAESRRIQAAADELSGRIRKYQLPHKEAYKAIDAKDKLELEEANAKLGTLIRTVSIARADRWSSEKIIEVLKELKADDYSSYGVKAADAIIQSKKVMASLKDFCVEVMTEEDDAKELAELRRNKAREDVKKEDDAVEAELGSGDKTTEFTGKFDRKFDVHKHVCPDCADPCVECFCDGENCIKCDRPPQGQVYLPQSILSCEKCKMLVGVIESMFDKHREFVINETLADEDEYPDYESSVEKKRVDGIMNNAKVI